MDPARYDGSRPEPPYNTDTDAVVMLQDELDIMTADRDRLAAELQAMRDELARVRRNHLRRMIDDVHARAISLENDFHTEQFRRSRRLPSDVTKARVRMLRMHRLLTAMVDQENRAALANDAKP